MDSIGSNRLRGNYFGERAPLFKLAFVTSLLTVLTLGIYRFWAKTRIRKYIWSSVESGGARFEYTGTGLEKFLGFLIAVVVLAIYMGIVQMALFYFGLNMFQQPTNDVEMFAQLGATYISLFALSPFIFFAAYRAQRYKMSRTRWRGVRFGMDKVALGYVWRGILYSLTTLFSLGILYPLQVFRLQKYMMDRSWYGNAQFMQGGKWTKLYKGLLHIVIAILILVAGVVIGAAADAPALMIIFMILGYVWLLVGFIAFGVYRMKYMAGELTLGDVRFEAKPQTGTIVKIYLIGVLLVMVVGAVIFGIAAAALAPMFAQMADPESLAMNMPAGSMIMGVVLYLVALVIMGALTLVFITQPIIAHLVSSVTVLNADGLSAIRQREGDSGADAEGFADALDFGGL